MSYLVKYLVPVYVEVDGDEVVSVHVGDEEIGRPVAVLDEDFVTEIDGDEAVPALKVAEAASWPGWEFGW
jgi:hypothetical protein